MTILAWAPGHDFNHEAPFGSELPVSLHPDGGVAVIGGEATGAVLHGLAARILLSAQIFAGDRKGTARTVTVVKALCGPA